MRLSRALFDAPCCCGDRMHCTTYYLHLLKGGMYGYGYVCTDIPGFVRLYRRIYSVCLYL